jgi:hypothetical protein
MSRMVGKPEVIWLRLDQPLSRSARNTGFAVKSPRRPELTANRTLQAEQNKALSACLRCASESWFYRWNVLTPRPYRRKQRARPAH